MCVAVIQTRPRVFVHPPNIFQDSTPVSQLTTLHHTLRWIRPALFGLNLLVLDNSTCTVYLSNDHRSVDEQSQFIHFLRFPLIFDRYLLYFPCIKYKWRGGRIVCFVSGQTTSRWDRFIDCVCLRMLMLCFIYNILHHCANKTPH